MMNNEEIIKSYEKAFYVSLFGTGLLVAAFAWFVQSA